MRSGARVCRRVWLLGLVVMSVEACGGSSVVPPPNATGGSAGGAPSTGAGGKAGAGGNAGAPGTSGGAGTTNAGGAGGGSGVAGAGGRAGATGNGGGTGGGTAGGASGTGGSDAGIDADRDAAAPTSCDPLTQTTCLSNERCAWVATSATAGHAVCLADGTVAQGGACAAGAYGEATGLDNCRRGLACVNGQCQPICKTSPDSCAAHFVCTTYSSVFSSNGTTVAGVCAPTCNPLTQARDYDGAAACGSPTSPSSASPALGCFGKSVFTCAKVVYPNNKSDAPAAGPSGGGFFLNGCAPGYLPVLTAMTGSTQTICVALCQPGPTSIGATAQAAGVTPSTCPAAGAAAPHECRYWWWLQNPTSASFPDALSNTMGFCIDYTKYTGDRTGSGTTPHPSCTTLSATAHSYDATLTDAQYWGCQPYPPPPPVDAGVL